MAEKEERIAVAKMIVNTDDEGSAKLGHFKIYSSQEAIRKMCDAYFKAKDKGLMGSERVVAALNALLEGK